MICRRRSIPLVVAVLALALAAPSPIHAATLSAHGVLGAVKVSAGATAVLFDDSQFRVTGSCMDHAGGDFTARPYIKSKHANALYFISNGTGQDLDFDPSDGRVPFGATHVATGAVPDFEADDYDVEVYAVSAGGKVLIARVATGVHVRGADCLFSGLFQRGSQVSNVRKVAKGVTATLFDDARFRVTGTCVDNGGGNVTARTHVKTKRDNASYYASDLGRVDADWDRADGRVRFGEGKGPATGAAPAFMAYDYDQEIYVVSPGGRVMFARVAAGVNVLGAKCSFSGIFRAADPVHHVVRVSKGRTATLFENAQFKVTGRCLDNGGGDLAARTYIKSKKDNALYMRSDDGTSDLDFDGADPKVNFDSYYHAEGTGPSFQAYDGYQEVYALSAGGRALIARTATGVHVLGAACTFSGLFQHS